jgi:hypothetical protein
MQAEKSCFPEKKRFSAKKGKAHFIRHSFFHVFSGKPA